MYGIFCFGFGGLTEKHGCCVDDALLLLLLCSAEMDPMVMKGCAILCFCCRCCLVVCLRVFGCRRKE